MSIAATTRSARAQELHGVADLHAHLLSHLGFGGMVFHGSVEGPHSQALRWCLDVHGAGGISLQAEGPHNVGGYPQFDGWPRWNSRVHQQAHIDWIRRAHQGGLRLVVMYAVNNELMPAAWDKPNLISRNKFPTDDKSAIDRQVAYMKQLASRNTSWMEIAYSSADARRIIRQGKLAVVLGTEVDALGNWRKPEDLPADPNAARPIIKAEIERLHRMGIRQIIPIHFYDNAFGGAAPFNIVNELSGLVVHGKFFDMEPAPPATGIRFRFLRLDDFGKIALDMATLLLPAPLGNLIRERYAAGTGVNLGQQNRKGLNSHGRIAIEEMMRLGIIIDVDHMSDQSANDVLDMVERFPGGPYPVISSHSGYRDLAPDGKAGLGAATEANKSAALLERIRKVGGMAAVIVDQGMVKSYGRTISGASIPNDATGSSKSFAQSYLYLKDKMGGRNVALGTDININWQIRPRFGTYAAPDLKRADGSEASAAEMKAQARAQRNGVRYSTPLKDVRAYRWDGKASENDERFVWEAVALGRSSNNIDAAEMPVVSVIPIRGPGTNFWIKDVAKGIRHSLNPNNKVDQLPPLANFIGIPNMNIIGAYNFGAVQRGAFLAARGTSPGSDSGTRDVWNKVRPIWEQFEAMNGSNPPIPRSVAGNRDFDFNLEGMAHYGMLWEFLIDLKNVGLTDQDLLPLYRSAEHYVQVWAKCEPKTVIVRPPPGQGAPIVTSPGQPTLPAALRATMNPPKVTIRLTRRAIRQEGEITLTHTGMTNATLTVNVVDANSSQPIDAEIKIGNLVVGRANQPFTYTFRVTLGEGDVFEKPVFTVVKPGYPNVTVPYEVELTGMLPIP